MKTSISDTSSHCRPTLTRVSRHRALQSLLRCIALLPLIHLQAKEPDTAELRFDSRFAQPETLAAVPKPGWITHIEQRGGFFLDEPASWQVPAAAPDGSGRLTIHVDRSKMTGDLAATVLFTAGKDADLALQLFDSEGRVVVVDVLGNLVEMSEALATDTFIIPLSKYPSATSIVLRQIHGGLTVYGAVLYGVATEGPMVDQEVKNLAARLGDPLSPENPILKNLQSLAAANSLVMTPAPPPSPGSSGNGDSRGSVPGIGSKKPVFVNFPKPIVVRDPPAISSVRPFGRALSILVEDSHGGSDVYNEYNFGSAQLARILRAQGARVESTRDLKGFDPRKGLTRGILNLFDIVVFNGRFSGYNYPFAASEIAAVNDWVRAGGGLLVTCSGKSSGDHKDALYFNPLLQPFGLRFGDTDLNNGAQIIDPSEKQPVWHGLQVFYVYHGTSVNTSPNAGSVAGLADQSVLVARQIGNGRVVAFGGGSAMQNQALGSKIIQAGGKASSKTNTALLMNISLWLSGVDPAQ